MDWDARKAELKAVTDRYRSKDGRNYDCIIPVSGNKDKDSTYQVIRILELGLNPKQGFMGKDQGWDDVTYWLFQKA